MELSIETKICTKCGRELPYTQFYKNGKFRRQSRCIDCHKLMLKETYNRKMQTVYDYKSTKGCRKCGETKYYILDFHHRNPMEKDFMISEKMRCQLETMMVEIEKCDVLCANCHREWHYFLDNNILNTEDYEMWVSNELLII